MSELYTVTAEEGRLRFLPRTAAALEQAVLDESPLPGCGFVSRLGDPGLLHCVVFRHERKPGGVFVVETLSVILQVGSFKLRGQRIFRMAPIHHHYE